MYSSHIYKSSGFPFVARLNQLSAFLLLITTLPATEPIPTEQSDNANIVVLETLVIEAPRLDRTKQDITTQPLRLRKIVDLSEVLSGELIEASLMRKSGYGNEISLRGFSQANLPVMINSGFVEGACGSRKDPSLSHINMLSVERIIVREGPFDVEQPGSLGGYVNVHTRQASSGLSGEILGRVGSFDLHNAGFYRSGGNDVFQILGGYSYGSSGQYADGRGVKLWEFREGYALPYNEEGKNTDAFRKNDIWSSLGINTTSTSRLTVDAAYGEARDILTPRVDFDTRKETTKLGMIKWSLKDLATISDELTMNMYRNEVGHYPTQEFRSVAVPKNVVAKTNVSGASLRNMTRLDRIVLITGVDYMQRNWEADVYNSATSALLNGLLVPSVRVNNAGSYLRAEADFDPWTVGAGIRFDHASTEAKESLLRSAVMTSSDERDNNMVSGSITGRLRTGENASLFVGVGRGHRIPTGVERYIQGSPSYFGNPDLKPTTNNEMDIGYEMTGPSWSVRTKAFYSYLDNYIYQVVTDEGWQTFRNIDARVYGGDIKVNLSLGSTLSVDGGLAFQRGQKETQPEGNADRDLGQIAPFKCRLALNYSDHIQVFGAKSMLLGTVEWVRSGESRDIDEVVGEQQLPSWSVINLRVAIQHKSWSLVAGVENLLDETYAVANSYEWDVVGGTGANPIIVNEPGRSFYSSIGYSW